MINTRFVSFTKTTITLAAGTLLLAACSGDSAKPVSGAISGERSSYEVAGDHALGNPDAKITVVEYASVTCGACGNWHTNVWPEFKSTYVDTGKVRFVYREFPTGVVNLANVGHLLANCAGEDKFFGLIDVQMKRQNQIVNSADVKGEYVALAKSAGMNEAAFDACMADQEKIDRLKKVADDASNAGVTGTPTFFINGKKEQMFVIEDFHKKLAPLLGEDAPTQAEEKE
ncbi:MAG: disulfide bond formation protein DsbA [Robiginitomaculum sp.]|nr:MAG: disulfide bond formation protein DsbA [Robiginitomaculum sp.]